MDGRLVSITKYKAYGNFRKQEILFQNGKKCRIVWISSFLFSQLAILKTIHSAQMA